MPATKSQTQAAEREERAARRALDQHRRWQEAAKIRAAVQQRVAERRARGAAAARRVFEIPELLEMILLEATTPRRETESAYHAAQSLVASQGTCQLFKAGFDGSHKLQKKRDELREKCRRETMKREAMEMRRKRDERMRQVQQDHKLALLRRQIEQMRRRGHVQHREE